jgi:hypothetical protein
MEAMLLALPPRSRKIDTARRKTYSAGMILGELIGTYVILTSTHAHPVRTPHALHVTARPPPHQSVSL